MRTRTIVIVTGEALTALAIAGCTPPKSSPPPDETTSVPDEQTPVSYDANAVANAADAIAPGTSQPTQASASDRDEVARRPRGRGNR